MALASFPECHRQPPPLRTNQLVPYGTTSVAVVIKLAELLLHKESRVDNAKWPALAGQGLLVAILLNPPLLTTGNRSRNAVGRASQLLGYKSVEVVNLYTEPTSSIAELGLSETLEGWLWARPKLRTALQSADGLLGAWGVAGLSGSAQRGRDRQVAWLRAEASRVGLSSIWMVGGEPRHPSRWHQYVSDKYGRTTGGTFEERLRQVVVSVPL